MFNKMNQLINQLFKLKSHEQVVQPLVFFIKHHYIHFTRIRNSWSREETPPEDDKESVLFTLTFRNELIILFHIISS